MKEQIPSSPRVAGPDSPTLETSPSSSPKPIPAGLLRPSSAAAHRPPFSLPGSISPSRLKFAASHPAPPAAHRCTQALLLLSCPATSRHSSCPAQIGSKLLHAMETASHSESDDPFPVPYKSFSVDIKGNKTDVVICKYEDRFMVVVSQIGCMGTILHARKEKSLNMEPCFSVSVLFGKRDEPLLLSCARQLIEHISSCGSSRSLVISLGLKDHSSETLKDVVSVVIEQRLW